MEIYRSEGVLAELLEKVLFFVEYTTIPYRVIKISNLKKTGFCYKPDKAWPYAE